MRFLVAFAVWLILGGLITLLLLGVLHAIGSLGKEGNE